jgi:serine/threonine protein kinase
MAHAPAGGGGGGGGGAPRRSGWPAAARLSYRELHDAGVLLPPPPETFGPTIHAACPTPHKRVVHPFASSSSSQQQAMYDDVPGIFLVRRENAHQAYALNDPDQTPRSIGTHRHEHWGCIYYGFICPAVPSRPGEFQAPDPERPLRRVAIKRLHKAAVQHYLDNHGEENPLKEMARMEELGDNVHVLRHEEFLEDDIYVYIVAPYGTTLLDLWMPLHKTDNLLEPERCHAIFYKMLDILVYLLERGIHHHDVSPDNFLFLEGNDSNLVIFDLALSMRMPVNAATGHRAVIAPHARYGTYVCMDPIVFWEQHYDGHGMDLWAVGVILYFLLTNQVLYETPQASDLCFVYSIVARGLSSEPLNERAIEVFHMAANNPEYANVDWTAKLNAQATAHLNLSPEAVELLDNMLRTSPFERYTLAQVYESAYVQTPPR